MKVVLVKDLAKLGQKGAVVKVNDGYARNYLIPQKLAVLATEDVINNLARQKQDKSRKISQKKLDNSQALARLKSITLNIKMKADDKGNLYAAVTPALIISRLKKKGLSIAAKQVKMPQPVKKIGNHQVLIVLDEKNQASIHLLVEAEK